MWARQTVSGLGAGAGLAAALGPAARGTTAGKSTGSGGGATIRMWSAAMIRPVTAGAARALVGKPLILRLTTRGLCRPRLCSAGSAISSISTHSVMCWRRRGGKRGVERQVAPHDPHRMHEGELIRIAAGPLTGLVHQPPQREMHEQQAIELLLHETGPARAQHHALPPQRHLQFGKRTLAF